MTAATGGAARLTNQAAAMPEIVSTASRQKTDATSRKAEIIGEDEVNAEEELPYDTSTKTGKLAAALLTGKIESFAC